MLESLGLLLREEAEGRLYPYTNKSTSVIDALRLEACRLGVRERCGVAVVAVAPWDADASGKAQKWEGRSSRVAQSEQSCGGDKGAAACERGWDVRLADGTRHRYDSIIVACGGNASADLLPKGVSFHAPRPLLGPLITDTHLLRGLDKVRAKCALEACGHREVGEITFRSYGVSGIAAFNMSRLACAGDMLQVDFLPDFAPGESADYLRTRLETLGSGTWLDYTCGMLLPLVARAVLKAAGLQPGSRPDGASLESFHRAVRSFPLRLHGVGDKNLCQVHRGGVDVANVDPTTMQLYEFPGLHVAGEMVDVDGPCGGYNLHWAWTSGILAGRSATGDQGC